VFTRGGYLYCISGSPNYYDSSSTYNIKINYTRQSTPLSGWVQSCLLYRTDPVGGDRNGQPTAMLKINGQDQYILLGDYWTGGASSSQEGSRYTNARVRWVNETNIELSTDASFDLADVGADNVTVPSNDLLVNLTNAWRCNEAAGASMVDAISANNLTATGTGAIRGIHFGGLSVHVRQGQCLSTVPPHQRRDMVCGVARRHGRRAGIRQVAHSPFHRGLVFLCLLPRCRERPAERAIWPLRRYWRDDAWCSPDYRPFRRRIRLGHSGL
jgi:hypothetical protein